MSDYISLVPNSKIYEIDEHTLEDWYDFTDNVESILKNFCEVVNVSLSKKANSLSEYIDFYIIDENGNRKNSLIDLRLSNHAIKVSKAARDRRKRQAHNIDSNTEFKSIIVNNKTYKSYNDVLRELRKYLSNKAFK